MNKYYNNNKSAQFTHSILFVLISIFLFGCNKLELPDPVKEDPIFNARMDVNGITFEFDLTNAEVETDISYSDENLRFVESSIINNINSSSLQVRIWEDLFFDSLLFEDNSFHLPKEEIEFIGPNPSNDSTVFLVNTMNSGLYNPISTWNSGMVETTGRQLIIKDINPTTSKSVCLSLIGDRYCDMSYCKKWVPTQGDHNINGWHIKDSIIAPIFDSNPPGNITLEWENGSTIPERTIDTSGYYTMTSKSKESENIVTMYIEVDDGGKIIEPCFSGFKSYAHVFNNAPELGKVDIQFRDESGRVFSTSNVNQTNESYFNITDIIDSDLINQEGEPVKIIEFSFSCTLADNNENRIQISNASAKMAFRQ